MYLKTVNHLILDASSVFFISALPKALYLGLELRVNQRFRRRCGNHMSAIIAIAETLHRVL